MPAHLMRDAFITRLVMRQVAGRKEILEFWDINDAARANEHLDIQDDIEWLSAEKARKEK